MYSIVAMLIINARYASSGRYYYNTPRGNSTIYRGMVVLTTKDGAIMVGIGDHLLIEEPGLDGIRLIYKGEDTTIMCNTHGKLKGISYKVQLIDSWVKITLRVNKRVKIVARDYEDDYSASTYSLTEIQPVFKQSVDIGWAFGLPQKLCVYSSAGFSYKTAVIGEY